MERSVMDYEYARNYWRRVFVDEFNGQFSEEDFDEWS